MTPERWQQINDVFQSAAELESGNRTAFLKRACAGDDSLRRHVEVLLAADAEAGDFIAGNAAEDVARIVEPAGSPALIGQKLKHYEIVSVLGTGGMGQVFLARDSRLNRPVAVKTLPEMLSLQPVVAKRFQTEAKAAATLNHPNVATIYSVEETADNKFFITMEYVEGNLLNRMIPDDGLSAEKFLGWFIPLADALAHAHEKGIIHRDIKPGNIMITPAGVPKILDFGLARIEKAAGDMDDSTLHLTDPGQILGTPAYMSPEQAEGRQVDQRTDIFSFGVVMYEALTGKRPFNGDNYALIVSELLKNDPPSISDVKPETPFLLSRVVMRCLGKDKTNRFQTMREVRAILEEVKAAIEASASVSKPARRLAAGAGTRPKRFSNGSFFLLLTFLLLLAGGFAAWLWQQSKRADEKQIGRFSVDPPDDKSIGIFSTRLSPDGKYLLFASNLENERRLFLRPLDKFEEQPITGSTGAQRPFFSPDGEWIAFFLEEKTLKKIPFTGGTPLTICESCPSGLESDWGADDTIVIADREGLYRVAAGGGRPERLTVIDKDNGEISHRAPHILPGGRHVLFTVTDNKGSRSAVLSLATSERRFLDGAGQSSQIRYLSTGHIAFARGNQLFAAPFDLEKLDLGDEPRPVLEGIFSLPNFQIAQNGTLLYIPDLDRSQNSLVWVGRDGEAAPVFQKLADYRSPRLSPDGRHIAVQMGNDIWIFETGSGKNIRLTYEGENQVPVWTPDGRSVVFASRQGSMWDVYKRAADGTGSAEKILSGENRQLPYSFHPTQNVLALTTWASNQNTDIAMLSPGGLIEPFLNSPFIEDTPRFSPDGKWVAYFSMETGKVEVYVRSWTGENVRIPVSKNGGMYPVWSADGKEIFYRHGNKFFSVEMTASGPAPAVSSPRILFEGNYLTGYDISPDGKKFLMVKNEQGTLPVKLNVVLNWTEELKAAFAPAK